MGKTSFQARWLDNPDFKNWLRAVDHSKFKAYCSLCKTSFDVANAGKSDVTKHKKGQKHSALESPLEKGTQSTLSFSSNVSKSTINSDEVPPNAANDPNPSEQVPPKFVNNPMMKFRLQNEVIDAEILWAINRVLCHSSTRASESQTGLFKVMFPDSHIAAEFNMKKDKIAYAITYGIAPYLQDELTRKLSAGTKIPCYAVSIDESLNKVSQNAQMDVILRFWEDRLRTYYLTSLFPDKCDAETLLTTFIAALEKFGLDAGRIIQLATDGPNVNIKLFRIFREYLQENNGGSTMLLDVGTCSVHIVHGSFKTAHQKVSWKVNDFLRRAYFLFKDFPVRRSEYGHHDSSTKFPLKFCSICWLENVPALRRGLEILKPLRMYFKRIEEKKINAPQSQNYTLLKTILKDELLEAKMAFMLTIAEECHPFLLQFQSNNALFPFLYQELRNLIRTIGRKFLKKVSFEKFSDTDLIDVSSVDIGFGAKERIKKMKIVQVLEFKSECREFLKIMYLKLIEKCPISNAVVKGASALTPSVMINETDRERRISSLLTAFVRNQIFDGAEADRIKRHYLQLCEDETVKKYLTSYKAGVNIPLDDFILKINDFYSLPQELENFFKMIFIFFPSNAEVERGFSVNKECLVENLANDSLIAQRIVYDQMKKDCGLDVKNLKITTSMKQYYKNASSKRWECLKVKQAEVADEKTRKRQLTHELLIEKSKKKKLLDETEERTSILNNRIKYIESELGKI